MGTFKVSCPFCQHSLEADDAWIGMDLPCPACKQMIKIEKPVEIPQLRLSEPANQKKFNADDVKAVAAKAMTFWKKVFFTPSGKISPIALAASGAAVLVLVVLIGVICYFSSESYKLGKAEDLLASETATAQREAVKILQELAEKGNVEAQVLLGNCYNEGTGVSSDKNEAEKWYLAAADQNNAEAQYKLGWLYNSQWLYDGDNKSLEDAIRWYQLSGEQGNVKAQSKLGDIYFSIRKDYAKAVKWFALASEQGDAYSQLCLGICHYKGLGVAENLNEAAKYFKLAADQGEVKAAENLVITYFQIGYDYYTANGVERDLAKAFEYFSLAAVYDPENKHGKTQMWLGACYYFGRGVEQNYAEAVKWLKLAVATDKVYVDANYLLGLCYYEGKGVEKDYEQAVIQLKKAAAEKHAESIKLLAECYMAGYGKDDPDGICWLGKCYLKGWGVARDVGRAGLLFRLAAEAGSKEGARLRAEMDRELEETMQMLNATYPIRLPE